MPTAEQFYAASASLVNAASQADAEHGALAGAYSSALQGGRLSQHVAQTMGGAAAGITAAAENFKAVAAECDRRALICLEYDLAMTNYEAAYGQWQDDMDTYRSKKNHYNNEKNRWQNGERESRPHRPRKPTEPFEPKKPFVWVER